MINNTLDEAMDIPGYPGYKISKNGELFSLKKGSTPVKIKGSTWQGYTNVKLSNGENVRNVSIHRLVAEAFLPRGRGKNIVNHLDGNKSNNHVENLEWTDHKGNMKHYSETISPELVKKSKERKQDSVSRKLQVLIFAHGVYKDDPESFSKLFATTFDI